MRKIIVIITLFVLTATTAHSQYYMDYGVSVGASNYLGDIGGGDGIARPWLLDMKFIYSRWVAGGFFRYKFNSFVGAKASINYVRLFGDDSYSINPGRRGRNLSFRNDMFEGEIHAEFYVYKANDVGGTGKYRTDFNLYLFGGAGMFYSNPQGELNDIWYDLQPLETEGVSYSKFNFSLPLGFGFYYTLHRKYRLGLEFGWKATFTDYIDDVSTEYVLHEDPTTAALSDKSSIELTDQINSEYVGDLPTPSPTTYIPGRKRGDSSNDDSYMTATVNFSWVLRGKSKFYRSKNNWLFGKKKRKRRKSRAKF
ncbi:DUF6089 family protein [bacterium]|nr:DUF6089 family protein [bacterium]